MSSPNQELFCDGVTSREYAGCFFEKDFDFSAYNELRNEDRCLSLEFAFETAMVCGRELCGYNCEEAIVNDLRVTFGLEFATVEEIESNFSCVITSCEKDVVAISFGVIGLLAAVTIVIGVAEFVIRRRRRQIGVESDGEKENEVVGGESAIVQDTI